MSLDPHDSQRDAPAPSFIGRGIAWPLRVDHTGAIAMTPDDGDLAGSIRMILDTAPGERVMRPRFGCAIWDLMFEPINPNTLGLIEVAVRDALSEWEPRIDVEDIDVVDAPGTDGGVRIEIAYRLRSTNDRRNLVYPFYLIPHDEEG